MKNHLFRDRAPITEAGWEEIGKEAKRTLRTLLAARDPDLDAVTVTAAAREIGIAEDRAIFHGYKAAQIRGICEAQARQAVSLGSSHADYPDAVAAALKKLRDDGVEGPFVMVLSEQLYRDLTARTDGGHPILSHVQRLIGGDFELTVGQDFSIGYLDHTAERVRL